MNLLDGKSTSKIVKEELAIEVQNWISQGHRAPHLVAVIIGDNPASQSYVRSKIKSCEQVGFKSTLLKLDNDIPENELFIHIDRLNTDDDVDGYIVQLPLPKHINEDEVTMRILPKKDVDGFHPINLGRMMIGLPAYLPATPFGILTLLKKYNIPTSGKNCIILGRSNIVGTPLSILLSRKRDPGNCTVTLAHSGTQNIKELCKKADIIVAAIGKANFVTADMVKENAVIIDVGINRIDDQTRKKGYRLVGDVDFENVKEIASFITPVPGGVGLMTVVSLLQNTLLAAQNKIYA